MNNRASSTKPLFAYRYSKRLKIMATLTLEAAIGNQKCDTRSFVFDDIVIPLLGWKTATQLKVFKVENISNINYMEHLKKPSSE